MAAPEICAAALMAGLTLQGLCNPQEDATVVVSNDRINESIFSIKPKPADPPKPVTVTEEIRLIETPPAKIEHVEVRVPFIKEVKIEVIKEVPIHILHPRKPTEASVGREFDRRANQAITQQASIGPQVDRQVGTQGTEPLIDQRTQPDNGIIAIAGVGTKQSDEYIHPSVGVTGAVNNERIVGSDRYIQALVVTHINTQLDSSSGGKVILQTTFPVYGAHGSDILIPPGSRFVCDYKSPEVAGATRVSIICKRLLLGGSRGEAYEIAGLVTDQKGTAGVSGEVDTRLWEKYGTAAILTGIGVGFQIAAKTASPSSTSNTGAALEQGASSLNTQLAQIAAADLENKISLAPIVEIPSGTIVYIAPKSDWVFKKVL